MTFDEWKNRNMTPRISEDRKYNEYITSQRKKEEGEGQFPPQAFLTLGPDYTKEEKLKEIVCFCEEGAVMCHYECAHCHNVWCPEDKSVKQEICPNPDCMFTYRPPDAIVY